MENKIIHPQNKRGEFKVCRGCEDYASLIESYIMMRVVHCSTYLWFRISTLSARAVLGVNAPISQSLTLLRTLQKLGLGDLDLARGPDLSFVFLFVPPPPPPPPPPVFLVVVGGLGAGVLSRVAGTDKLTRDISLG